MAYLYTSDTYQEEREGELQAWFSIASEEEREGCESHEEYAILKGMSVEEV